MKAPRRNRNAQRVFTFLTQRGYTQSPDDCVPATALYTDFRSWMEESATRKDQINHQQFDRNLRIVAGVSMRVIDSDQGDGKRQRVYAGISAPDQIQVKEPAADMPALVTDRVLTPEVIEFMGQSLLSVKVDGEVYVPMKPIVEGMGLSWAGQHRKTKATERYSSRSFVVQTAGGKQRMCCIPFGKLINWLCSINVEKIHPDFRKFVTGQQEACLNPVSLTYTPEVVEFMGQSLFSVKVGDRVYVPMKPVVEGMGLDWKGQQDKITGIHRYGAIPLRIDTPGGPQEMTCLPLTKLNGWLFSINPDRVREEIREAVILYQDECFIVLHNYWNNGAAIRHETLTEGIKRKIIEAVESAHTVDDQTSSPYTDKDLDPLYGRLVTDDLTLADMVALLGEIAETARMERFARRNDTETFALDAKSIFPYVARAMTHYPDPLDVGHVENFKAAYCAIMRYYRPLIIKGVIGRLVTFYNLPRF